MSGISRDEWLTALKDAEIEPEHDADAVTIHEFAAMFGLKMGAAKHRLETLVELGKATRTRKRQPSVSGRMIGYIAYRLREPKPQKRRRA